MTKLVLADTVLGVVVPVAAIVGALNITGMLGLPTNSVFVQVEVYRMVILLTAFT